MEKIPTRNSRKETMTVGGGCFWCIEAIFNQINGVEKVVSGYMGGTVPGSPTYREVRSGLTGHAEVVQVTFNPQVISYENLLGIFMTSHDPTTLNRQGADVGTQYRSVVFYYNEIQKKTIQKVFSELATLFTDPIITEVKAVERFHPAEESHQDFYGKNPEEVYCEVVIVPKLKKLREQYLKRLK